MKQFAHISAITNCLELPSAHTHSINNACVDTRLLQRGDLFFALPGDRVDGHDFVDEAAIKGASAAVVLHGYNQPCMIPLIHVPNTLIALQKLAATALQQSRTKVIGITGSIGKTTTKELLATLLEEKFRVARSPKNYNSQIGLPLAILNYLNGDEDYLIQEMGMTASGQIRKLIEIAPPHFAVATYIALVHAAFFNSIDEIAEAKAEIFTHPSTKIGFFPETIQCRSILEAAGACKKQSVSMTQNPYGTPSFPGTHLHQNFLLAAAVAKECGMNNAEINARIPFLQLPEKRQELVEKNGIVFVNDSYNACAPSVIAALNALPVPKHNGKRIAVIGEMLELGKFSESCHQEVGEASLEKVDHMLCLGTGCAPIVELWKQKGRPVSLFEDRNSLVKELKGLITRGDVILLKGSNSKQLWKILDEV